MRIGKNLLALAAASALFPAFAGAQQTANFDFNGARSNEPQSGTISIDGPRGGSFVGVDAVSSTGTDANNDALAPSGSQSGISFTIGPVGGDTVAGPGADTLSGDYVFVTGNPADSNPTATLNITGIAGTTADLFFYTGTVFPVVVIAGETSDPFPTGTTTGPFGDAGTLFFDDVPVSGGSIAATLGNGTAVTTLGGFTVDVVPEPAALSLLALGGLGLLARRRKA